MQLCGTITAPDGSKWELPAPVTDGPAAVDIYNDCTGQGDNPNYLEQVKTVVIDPDGVEITGYIFADNYYELWVNGKFGPAVLAGANGSIGAGSGIVETDLYNGLRRRFCEG